VAEAIDRVEGIGITERNGFPEPGTTATTPGARQDAVLVSRSSYRSLCIVAFRSRPGAIGQPVFISIDFESPAKLEV